MNAAVTPRSQISAKKTTVSRGKKKSPRRSSSRGSTREARLLSFTIDPDTAHVVRFEALDGGGGRHELSEEEKATLIRDRNAGQLEDVLERVFEAGIGCVLGEEASESKPDDTEEDAELRHLLLTRLIQHSAARDLMRREALNRVVLGALIRESVQTPPMVAASGTEARTRARRASPARAKSRSKSQRANS